MGAFSFIYSTFNLTNPHPLLILKNLWSTPHQFVRVANQLTKYMRTNRQFLLDRLCIFTRSKHFADCLSNGLQ